MNGSESNRSINGSMVLTEPVANAKQKQWRYIEELQKNKRKRPKKTKQQRKKSKLATKK